MSRPWRASDLKAAVCVILWLCVLAACVAQFALATKTESLLSELEAEAPEPEHRLEVVESQRISLGLILYVIRDRVTGAEYAVCKVAGGAAMARLPEKGEGMTYLYRCAQCGEFEAVQRITAKPLKRCPDCGGRVKRVVSGGAGFRLKGSGWTSPGRV